MAASHRAVGDIDAAVKCQRKAAEIRQRLRIPEGGSAGQRLATPGRY